MTSEFGKKKICFSILEKNLFEKIAKTLNKKKPCGFFKNGTNKINKLRKDFMTLISISGGNLNTSLNKKDFQLLFSSDVVCHQ